MGKGFPGGVVGILADVGEDFSLNSHKIVDMTNGTDPQDGVTVSQMETAIANGSALTDIQYHVPLSALNLVSDATLPVLARNAQGNWTYNRVAAGAENIFFGFSPPYLRTTADKGWKVTGIRVTFYLGVVDATSIDIHSDKITWGHGIAEVVAANFGGAILDAHYDANHDSAAKRKDATVSDANVMTLTFATPVFFNTTSAVPVFELAVVLAATGTFSLADVTLLISEA